MVIAHDEVDPPQWRLLASRSCYSGETPHDRQQQALAAWQAHGRRGVVEAGTGKIAVGVLATAAAVDAGERVLVLVPDPRLLQQWHHILVRDLPAVGVARIGGGHRDSPAGHQVVIAVADSAATRPVLPRGAAGLIVADEVHRYGAPSFANARDVAFAARLGLTATYTRTDDHWQQNLVPYFGRVVATCDDDRGPAHPTPAAQAA